MKRNTFAVLALGLSLVPMAHAQSEMLPTNLSIRLGYVYPLERNTRDYTGAMGGFGVDFNTSISLMKNSQGYFSIDFMTGAPSGDRGYFLPIMYNVRVNLGQTPVGQSAYFFAGAGAVNMDLGISKTVFGARGGIGAQLTEKTFIEASYLWSDENNGARANSFGIHYGFKF